MNRDEIITKVIKALIKDKRIPITYRNTFKQYLKWRAEKGE